MKFALGSLLTILCFTAFTCDDEDCSCNALGCTQAIVKDHSNLDGCGIGLELADGTVLMPERRVYVQAPKPEEDPAYYFEFVAGDTVCIAYNEVELMTNCMKGKNVFLTCIKKISSVSSGD